MSAQLVLAIDQGTTGTTSLVVDIGSPGVPLIVGRGYAPASPTYPQAGWVEVEPELLWRSVETSATNAIGDYALHHGLSPAQAAGRLLGLAVTNQRETALAWHAASGQTLGPGIVWQDRRTAPQCAALVARGGEPELRARTGLVADPYFSASKWLWLLHQHPDWHGLAARGEIQLGTVDSYLLYRLTGRRTHRTDTTNAARTGVFDLHTRRFEPSLCALWGGVPYRALPEVCASDAHFGETRGLGWVPDGLPIVGMLGDQHAALVGQGCCRAGLLKCTLGTGGFALLHTGAELGPTPHALVQTIAYDFGGQVRYALEGSMFVAGALIEWLRDGLTLVRHAGDISRLAAEVSDTGGVTIVPALTGLGAPHWRPEARGVICGIGRETRPAHVARAALEGIALQSTELLQHMAEVGGANIERVRMDGGAAADDLLLQMHADLLGWPVVRPRSVEATGLGAALTCAVGLGRKTEHDLLDAFAEEKSFAPQMAASERAAKLASWQRAVRFA